MEQLPSAPHFTQKPLPLQCVQTDPLHTETHVLAIAGSDNAAPNINRSATEELRKKNFIPISFLN